MRWLPSWYALCWLWLIYGMGMLTLLSLGQWWGGPCAFGAFTLALYSWHRAEMEEEGER